MKLRRIIIKVILGVISFSIGSLFGLLTIDRFSSTPPPEVEPIAGDYIAWYFGSSMSAIHNTKKNMDIPPRVIGYKTNGKYITIKQHPDMPQNAIYKHVDYPEYNPDNHYYWIIPQQHKTSEATMTQPRYYLLFLNYFTGIFSIRR